MTRSLFILAIAIAVLGGCSKPEPADQILKSEAPAVPMAAPSPAQTGGKAALERPPIDIGDVDSGVFIRGTLAQESESETVTAEYIETLRGTLSLATITVKEPFPERLMVRFDLAARRNFVERPVVVRMRALRGESEALGGEYACVLGSNAINKPANESDVPAPLGIAVNALEGLEAIPDTLLLYGRADAWLMPEGSAESILDPRTAESSDKVALIGNPVRINFVRGEPAQ